MKATNGWNKHYEETTRGWAQRRARGHEATWMAYRDGTCTQPTTQDGKLENGGRTGWKTETGGVRGGRGDLLLCKGLNDVRMLRRLPPDGVNKRRDRTRGPHTTGGGEGDRGTRASGGTTGACAHMRTPPRPNSHHRSLSCGTHGFGHWNTRRSRLGRCLTGIYTYKLYTHFVTTYGRKWQRHASTTPG